MAAFNGLNMSLGNLSRLSRAKTRSISAVTMAGKVVTLTISPAVTSNDNVVVAYAVPALNALHDATGNNTAPFTFSAANQTPIVAPPAGAGGAGIVSSAPFLGALTSACSTRPSRT